MKVIVPIAVEAGDTLGTDTILTATNVAEDDYDDWSAGSFDAGDRVLFEHGVYEALSTTTDQPDTGAAKDTPTWVRVSAANRWKMFDGSPSAQTESEETIEVEIEPGAGVNALAALGLVGQTLTVVVDDDGGEGVVYQETIDLQDTSNITNWNEWAWEDFQYRQDIVLFDLPGAYPDATISVTIDNGSATAKCGELVIGRQRAIGDALFGTSVGIKNYSTFEEDMFGVLAIVRRGKAKKASIPVSIATAQAYIVQRVLADLADIPAVYVGDPDRPETIVFGISTFEIRVETPSRSDCSLDIRGQV
jgi:hypothetical protein